MVTMNPLHYLFFNLLCLSGLLQAGESPDLKFTQVTTNIESVKDGRVANKGLDRIIDADNKTYYWTGAQT